MKPTSNKKLKVLFVHSFPLDHVSSFVKQDLMMLQQLYQVKEITLASFNSLVRAPITSPYLWRTVARSDLVFAWFGICTPVIIIAKILGKPSLLVGGGEDVVSIPSIGYGVAPKWWRSFLTLGFRLASRALLFSDSSRQSLISSVGRDSKNFQTLYLGVDADYFKPCGSKKAQALTVGYISEVSLRRKGIQTYIEAARVTPEIPYRLAGRPLEQDRVESIRVTAPPNLDLLGYLDEAQLLTEYQQAKAYAQLSVHEGFGMALAEAMACECVPVVTRQGSIPEVVGDTGIYVPVEDSRAAGEAIRQVVNSVGDRNAKRARQRIVELFPISRRREELKKIVETVVSCGIG